MRLVIVDYLDSVSITRAINETNPILIIDSNAPLTNATPNQLFQFVTRRHSQKSYLGSGVDQQ
jgi:hypothetical protein